MGMRLRGVLGFVVVIAFVAGGCAGKKRDTGVRTGPGITEEGLAAEGSLEKFKTGAAMPESGIGPLQDINFAFDSYELDEASRGALRANSDWLKSNPRVNVEIEGHCDERGTIEYNLALGAKRARAAKEYLTALGVDASRLTTISYGEELPLCQEHNEDCWKQNRRGHFVLLRD